MLIMQRPALSRTLALTALVLVLVACEFGAEKTPESHLEKAREFIAADDLNAGVIELKNALQLESNLPEARWLLGKIYLQAGNGAAAFKEISQAQSLGFSDPEMSNLLLQAMLLQGRNQEILDQTFSEDEMSTDTLVLRGNAHLALGEFDDARKAFNETIAKDRDSVTARKGLIRVALQTSKVEEAGRLLEETLAFALEDAEVWMLKGQHAFQLQQPEEAEKAFAKAIVYSGESIPARLGLVRALLIQGKTNEALEPLQAVEARAANHPLAKYYRGYLALLNGETETAKSLLQEVLNIVPSHPESLLLLGRLYFDEGKLEQAKSSISTFLGNYPQHIPARKLLSVIQLKMRQPGESIKTLSDAASQSKGDWQVLALLGSSLMESGEMEKGMELLAEAVEINPDTAALRTQIALGHIASGSLESAVSELESAVDLDPELIRADILLILTHLKAGKVKAAIKAANKLAEKHPENPLSYNLLGASYIRAENTEKAIENFSRALELKPDFTPAIINLARIDLKNNKLDDAEQKFLDILDIDKNNADALIHLAQIESTRNNREKLRGFLEQARSGNPNLLQPRVLLGRYYLGLRDSDKLVDVLDEAKKLSPSHPDVLMLLGQSYRLKGDIERSIETFEKLQKLAPESNDVLFQLAVSQSMAGKNSEARELLQAILERDQNNYRALATLARVWLAEKEYAKAQSQVEKIKKTRENIADAYSLEGDIYIAQGKFADAISAFTLAHSSSPNSLTAINLARAYKLSGDEKNTVATLKNWLAENPNDEQASLFLGSLYQQSTDNQQAIEKYEATLKLNPDNVVALNNLVWLYLDSDPDKAVSLARRAHALAPDSPEVMDTLGWVLVQQKNLEEGLAYLEPARKAGGHIPGIRYHYAAALHLAGDNERALGELNSLLTEHASFAERKEAEALLKKVD